MRLVASVLNCVAVAGFALGGVNIHRALADNDSAANTEIVLNGQAHAVVILADKPTRSAQIAAKEFVHYVKKMTGADLPVIKDSEVVPESLPGKVFIGESGNTRKLGLSSKDFAEQEYLIRADAGILLLMGKDEEDYGPITYEKNGLWPGANMFTPLGTIYAVHTFLEDHGGVRWYLPGEIGEVCPQRKNLAVGRVNVRKKPWTRFRFNPRGFNRDPFHFYDPEKEYKMVRIKSRDDILWKLRLKWGGSPYAFNHSVHGNYYKRFSKTHPEWWQNGKRTYEGGGSIHADYSHPDLIKQVAEDAITHFSTGKAIPGMSGGAGYFSVMPDDGRKNLIWSDRAKALRNNDPDRQDGFGCGWASDFVFSLVNGVARIVYEKFPDKWITCCAYGPYYNPPKKIALSPNISIMQVGCLMKAYGKDWEYQAGNLREWSKLTRELYVWEYTQEQWFAQFKSFPVIFPRKVAQALQFMQETGGKGMFFGGSCGRVPGQRWSDNSLANPAEDLLNQYMTFKYLCDASRNPEEVLDEHYRLFYGPAQAPMKKFFELIESRWHLVGKEITRKGTFKTPPRDVYWERMCNHDVMEQLEGHIAEALKLAESAPYERRVRMMDEAVFRPTKRKFLQYQNAHSARKRIHCLRTTKPPRIDGRMEKHAWARAAQTAEFVSTASLQSPVKAYAWVMRDSANLYIALRCGAALGESDQVSVFLDPHRTREKYYQVTVTHSGQARAVLIDKEGKENPWSAALQVAVDKGEGSWSAELRLPLKDLGIEKILPQEVWGINFLLHRAGIDLPLVPGRRLRGTMAYRLHVEDDLPTVLREGRRCCPPCAARDECGQKALSHGRSPLNVARRPRPA